MSKPLVSDDQWEAIAPLLPKQRPKPQGGRPQCDDRLALAGIIFILRSGIPWEMLPREFGCSGMTCWRRLPSWQAAGVWSGLHRVLLERLLDDGQVAWSRASLDSAAVAAKRGVPRPARTQRIAESRGRPPSQAPRQAPRRQGLRPSPLSGESAAPAPSLPVSPVAARTAAKGWAGTAGLSNERWHGSTAFAVSPSSTNDAPTSTRPS